MDNEFTTELYTAAAALEFQVPMAEVTQEQREAVKVANYERMVECTDLD